MVMHSDACVDGPVEKVVEILFSCVHVCHTGIERAWNLDVRSCGGKDGQMQILFQCVGMPETNFAERNDEVDNTEAMTIRTFLQQGTDVKMTIDKKHFIQCRSTFRVSISRLYFAGLLLQTGVHNCCTWIAGKIYS